MKNQGLQSDYGRDIFEFAFLCLDLDCKYGRYLSPEDLTKHYEHLNKCVTTSFLKTIAENARQKLHQCTQIEALSNIQQINGLFERVNQLITTLDKQSYENYEDFQQLLSCYHGQTENEIVNIMYNELVGIDIQYFLVIKSKVNFIFSYESAQYLQEKFLDNAHVLEKVSDFEGAMNNYQLALKLVSNDEAQIEIEEQMWQIFLKDPISYRLNQFKKSGIKNDHQNNIREIQQQKEQKNYLNELFSSAFLTIQQKPYCILFSDQIALIMTFLQQKEIQQGLLLILFNSKEQALIYFEEKLKLYGLEQRVDICYIYTLILLAFKREKEAFQHLQACLEINKMDFNFKLLKILMLMYFEHFNEARAMILQDHDSILDQQSVEKLSLLYCIFVDDYSQGLKHTDSLLSNYPDNEFLLYFKMQLFIELNQQYPCLQDIESIQDNLNFRKTILKSRLKQQYENALKLIEIKQQYDFVCDEDIQADKIVCLYEMQNYQAVNNLIDTILPSCYNPMNVIRVQLIKILNHFQLQQFSSAIYNLEELTKYFNFNNKLQINYLKGQLLFKLMRYDESLKCFTQYCEKFNYSIKAYFCIATIKCYQGEFQEAIRLYDYTLNMNENYYQAIYNKGIALFLSKSHKEAQKCFIQTQSYNARSQQMIVFCQLLEGNKNIEISFSILKQLNKYQKYLSILKIAAYIITETYEKAQLQIDSYYANHEQRKPNLDRFVLLSQGILLFKTAEIQCLEKWISEVDLIQEEHFLLSLLRQYIQGANTNDQEIMASYLQSVMIIKYDTKEFNDVPKSIDILHYQIDFESFVNYIRIVFN